MMEKAKHQNGVAYPLTVRVRAREMRRQGMTHREIRDVLGISLGSADLWTRGISLSEEQKQEIQKRKNQKIFTPEWRKQRNLWAKERWHHPRKYHDQDLIERIRTFHAEHGRIPLKREFNALRIYRERFGSWNNAIRLAGFDPNPVLFDYRFRARDGHQCDSFSKRIIDDWFFEQGIAHERHVPYPDAKMTADFVLPDGRFVEFFGLAGVQRKYDSFVERKRRLCAASGITLIEIYPRDLFPKNNLGAIFDRSIVGDAPRSHRELL